MVVKARSVLCSASASGKYHPSGRLSNQPAEAEDIIGLAALPTYRSVPASQSCNTATIRCAA